MVLVKKALKSSKNKAFITYDCKKKEHTAIEPQIHSSKQEKKRKTFFC
jgi:hypothetical protein